MVDVSKDVTAEFVDDAVVEDSDWLEAEAREELLQYSRYCRNIGSK